MVLMMIMQQTAGGFHPEPESHKSI